MRWVRMVASNAWSTTGVASIFEVVSTAGLGIVEIFALIGMTLILA